MSGFFVDTNVLIDASNRARSSHLSAIQLLGSGLDLSLSAQVIREYLGVATRPAGRNGLGLSPDRALRNLDELRRVVRLVPEERPLSPTLLSLIRDHGCRGRAIHDANIVAAMLVHGIPTLVTANVSDFARYADRVEVQTLQSVQQ